MLRETLKNLSTHGSVSGHWGVERTDKRGLRCDASSIALGLCIPIWKPNSRRCIMDKDGKRCITYPWGKTKSSVERHQFGPRVKLEKITFLLTRQQCQHG